MEWENVWEFLNSNIGVAVAALLWGSVAVPLWAKLKKKYGDRVRKIEAIATEAYNFIEKAKPDNKYVQWQNRVEGYYNGLYKGKMGNLKAMLTGMGKAKALAIAKEKLEELVYGSNLAKSKPSGSGAEG